jgi:hypothetical protein
MNKLFGILISFFIMSFCFVSAATFVFNGTIYDINGNPLNNTNVTINLKQGISDIGSNSTTTNSSGWFNFNVTSDASYMYQLTLVHRNSTTNAVDYVGQSLPSFPYAEFSDLSNITFYLKEAGTLNITTVNRSGNIVPNNQVAYQIKDTKLGYPVNCQGNLGTYDYICYVPKNRNYSIMVYPAQGSSQHFVPVSFNWNNFSSTSDYTIGTLSSYNATKRQLNKQFNVTESFSRVTGHLNGTSIGVAGWDNLTIVPFLLEPGNMIFMTYGTLPYNVSTWNGETDYYNLTTGFYNISLPYAASETVKYMLFAAGQNGSSYYGSYRNITVSAATHTLNFTAYGLLGSNSIINMSGSTGGNFIVGTKRQTFNLVNESNATLSNVNAHVEIKVDYSNYNSIEFIFMEEINGVGTFSLPLINVTGVKEFNIFSMTQAPKRVGTKTVAQIQSNPNITMTSFTPGEIDAGQTISMGSMTFYVYKSNTTCDVPTPPDGCLMKSFTLDTAQQNMFPLVVGGGALSPRISFGSISVHYVNVDMLASGPPDSNFDNAANEVTSGASFSSAMRFGSQGPTIYDYVLVSMPYTEGSSTTTGLNENADINMSIPNFYDEDWNVVWNTTANGTSGSAFAGNNSHYQTYQSDWAVLMNATNCTRNQSYFNSTRPCYIDTENNRIWMRLPHFSGTGTDISGSKITASSSPGSSGGGGGGSSSNTQTITLTETAQEFSSMSAGSKLSFTFDGSKHTLEVDRIASDRTSAEFILMSDPVKFTLKVGEEKIIDLVTTTAEQLYVKLVSINSARADLVVKKIIPVQKKPLVTFPAKEEAAETEPAEEIKQEIKTDEVTEQGLETKPLQPKDYSILGFIVAALVVIVGLGSYLYILKKKY